VPYIEALASGTPVVATPNVGAREVLDEGRFGVLSDDADLGADLLALLRNEPRRAHLAEVGSTRAADYDWPVVVARYEAIYRELIANPRRRGAKPRTNQ
jgi:glycosyltransferase involved in cell wall biosynthesis